jgi:hypothetical protein
MLACNQYLPAANIKPTTGTALSLLVSKPPHGTHHLTKITLRPLVSHGRVVGCTKPKDIGDVTDRGWVATLRPVSCWVGASDQHNCMSLASVHALHDQNLQYIACLTSHAFTRDSFTQSHRSQTSMMTRKLVLSVGTPSLCCIGVAT